MTDEEEKGALAAHLILMRSAYENPVAMDAPLTQAEIEELGSFLAAIRTPVPTDAVHFTCAKCGGKRWQTKEEYTLMVAEATLQYTEEQIAENGGMENMPRLCSTCYKQVHLKPLEN
jgi:hypothetical protein